MRWVILASSLLFIAEPAGAEITARTPDIGIASPKAYELLEVVSPSDELQRQLVQNFQKSFNQGLENDPKILTLEKRKPGLIASIETTVAAQLKIVAPAEVVRLQNVLAAAYQQLLTEEDMDVAIAFFKSPAGKRAADKMKAGGQEAIDSMRQNGSLGQDLSKSMNKAVDSASTAGLEGLSAEDSAAFVEFSKQPASYKLIVARSQILAVATAEAQAMTQRIAEKIGPQLASAMQRHMTSK
ncbi:DUF2059 domain-containing protein [Sphingobium sp. DEHP117]|uniref:DUF2059 domain-containing protein n=1 Tax=Sphingobium sp. DEHP117 TaxID=2993436 RepID=UPI0027D71CEC|nr:DUF2059 domain-containing protein [Sphingobium sp. DEHP117]MDQ4419519.1 DUF2059 domain-containing protein [Sphingobium sp. DEHP117]